MAGRVLQYMYPLAIYVPMNGVNPQKGGNEPTPRYRDPKPQLLTEGSPGQTRNPKPETRNPEP